MRREDVTWQYGTKVNDKGIVRCNFCNKEMGGGIYRLKEYLAWVKGNVTGCKEVLLEIKQQIIKIITEGKYKKIQRERDAEEIGKGYESPIDEEDDQEVEFEAQMERARIASIQELNYRQMQGQVLEVQLRKSLEVAVHDVDKHMAQFKVYWPGTGVTIMTDGWKDKSHRYLVNFLIGCPRSIVYHFSIDLLRKRHTGRLICAHLNKIVHEVGPENVVQVVTNNAANYKKVGLLLMERRLNLYWTPCAAHCINLMLKEIRKLKRVYIYNHMYLHALMREHCMREIVRESITRFATTFFTIQSILVNKKELRSMLWSNKWQADTAAMSQLGRQVETTFLDRRLSDFDDKPAIGFLFDVMRHDADIIAGVRNCIYRLKLDLETQMQSQWWMIHGIRTKQLQKIAIKILSQTYYTPINFDYIFQRDLAYEWVSLRTPLLNQDFLRDITMDIDDDYTQDEYEAQDVETDGTMENNWQEPVIQEYEGAPIQTAPSPKTG
ncbi:hypothetical protein AMTRI_Chr11g98470 [Amborella trichopoda]